MQSPLPDEGQPQIARIHAESGNLAGHENQIAPMNGVRENRDPARHREVPERRRHDAATSPFGRDPLDEEPRSEARLTTEPQDEPEPVRHVGLQHSMRNPSGFGSSPRSSGYTVARRV